MASGRTETRTRAERPGEMRRFEARRIPETRPRHVDGFNELAALRLLPVVPPQPPLPAHPTARRVFHLFLAKSTATVAAVLVVIEVLPAVGLPQWWSGLSGLLALYLAHRWWTQI